MTAARASEIVHRAAAAWSAAQCSSAAGGTQPVAIQTVDVAQGRCPGARGGARNEVRFTTEPSDGDALAITDMTFDAQSGGLLSAITRVSTSTRSSERRRPRSMRRSTTSSATRWAISLGLAHSERSDAVMNATFRTRASDALERRRRSWHLRGVQP